MKILYKQPIAEEEVILQKSSVLERFGITACHLKLVEPAKDRCSITTRAHHHTGCELHVILEGIQRYWAEGTHYDVAAGSLILLPPGASHQHLYSAPSTRKYSISFSAAAPSALVQHLTQSIVCMPLPPTAQEALQSVAAEVGRRSEYADAAIECALFSFLLAVARSTGLRETPLPPPEEEDPRVVMAKQYVLDNIDRPITCPELAAYCHVSQKQLTRLFLLHTELAPAAYIRSRRITRIEQLLAETDLSLKQISELLQFTSEYHFNSFFTKYAGMTPGAFRRMMNNAQ